MAAVSCGLGSERIFKHANAVPLKSGEKIFNLFGRMHFGRQDLINLIAEQISSLLAQVYEVTNLIVLLFNLR